MLPIMHSAELHRCSGFVCVLGVSGKEDWAQMFGCLPFVWVGLTWWVILEYLGVFPIFISVSMETIFWGL